MSDTPRTDDQIGHEGSTMTMVRIDFARTLEREITRVTAERDKEFMSGEQFQRRCAKAEAERDAAIARLAEAKKVQEFSCQDWADTHSRIEQMAKTAGVVVEQQGDCFVCELQIVEALCARLAEAEKDMKRVDYIETLTEDREGNVLMLAKFSNGDIHVTKNRVALGIAPRLRAAIDAALAKQEAAK